MVQLVFSDDIVVKDELTGLKGFIHTHTHTHSEPCCCFDRKWNGFNIFALSCLHVKTGTVAMSAFRDDTHSQSLQQVEVRFVAYSAPVVALSSSEAKTTPDGSIREQCEVV